MNENPALTPQEVADILKIAKNTVYEIIKRGELNSYRVGKKVRVDLKDVEEYRNRNKSIKSKNDTSSYNNIRTNPLMYEEIPNMNGFVICGQDILLDILSRHLQLHPNGIQSLRSYIGSYNGLYSLYHGRVQVTTAHLWDGETDTYNIPYVKRMLPGVPAIIIHIAKRIQGFYVSKGNPKKILTWKDLKRDNIKMINREKGSGTRVLLDEHLNKLKISPTTIKGYTRESTSHLAIASTVARGGADVGIGNEMSGMQVKEIDFIPLQKERYELVIKAEDFNKKPFQAILDILNSEDFKLELEGIGGYEINETGKIIHKT
jgi:putative molybdopterin biosynthesis protein